jgi:hypothetical protein
MIVFPVFNIIIFTLIAVIHVYWAFGGKWGGEHVIPKLEGKSTFEPGLVATLIVAVGLLGFAAVHARVLGCCDIGSDYYVGVLILIIAGIFLLRAIGDFKYVGFFKKRKDSTFATYDSKYYSPLCLIIFTNAVFTYFML